MKMNILDRIDSYYANRDKKDFWYTLLAIALAIGFVIFYFITPPMEDFVNLNEKKVDKFKKNLYKNTMELNTLKAKNIRIQRELRILKKKLVELKKDKIYYSQLVNLLDFVQFNKQDWAQFVKNSIIDAKSQGLEVKLVKNMDANVTTKKNKSFIIKKMNFGLSMEGEYKNFIYYMYKYENIKMLIRVNKFKIITPDKYYIEFYLYGYKL